jgi:hypothetical protein
MILTDQLLNLTTEVKQFRDIDLVVGFSASESNLSFDNALIVFLSQILQEDLIESVKEGFGKSLSPSD